MLLRLSFRTYVKDGWTLPENVTELFYENAIHGGVIHSNLGHATTLTLQGQET